MRARARQYMLIDLERGPRRDDVGVERRRVAGADQSDGTVVRAGDLAVDRDAAAGRLDDYRVAELGGMHINGAGAIVAAEDDFREAVLECRERRFADLQLAGSAHDPDAVASCGRRQLNLARPR